MPSSGLMEDQHTHVVCRHIYRQNKTLTHILKNLKEVKKKNEQIRQDLSLNWKLTILVRVAGW